MSYNQKTIESICDFVTQNYSVYQGSFLCGKCAEIVCFLLSMAGIEGKKVSCHIGDTGHVYVLCGDYIIDPSIKQFGEYPEFSVGEHPLQTKMTNLGPGPVIF